MEEPFTEALERYLGETLHDQVRVVGFPWRPHAPRHSWNELTSCMKLRLPAGSAYSFAARGERGNALRYRQARWLGSLHSGCHCRIRSAFPQRAQSVAPSQGHGVAFVVPGNQALYPRPCYGGLREHFRAPKLQDADGLSPAAQAVLFHHLLRPDEDASTAVAHCHAGNALLGHVDRPRLR